MTQTRINSAILTRELTDAACLAGDAHPSRESDLTSNIEGIYVIPSIHVVRTFDFCLVNRYSTPF